jgi:hypothetical protein
MEKTILLGIIIVLMIGAPSAYAMHKPYWSATPVNSPNFKQFHVILTHINYGQGFGIGKTKIILVGSNSTTDKDIKTYSHIIDVSKHVKPTQLNTTLDAGYFVIPTSMLKQKDLWWEVRMLVLNEDEAVAFHVNDTTSVFIDLNDYYMSI